MSGQPTELVADPLISPPLPFTLTEEALTPLMLPAVLMTSAAVVEAGYVNRAKPVWGVVVSSTVTLGASSSTL